MPHFPSPSHEQPSMTTLSIRPHSPSQHQDKDHSTPPASPPSLIRIKNRRKRYLDTHPSYFDSRDLELADPLLYDRLIRRYQTPAEREAEGRSKGYSGVLEADLMRSEAKLQALSDPTTSSLYKYKRGKNGEIVMEDDESEEDQPNNREDAEKRWRWEMEMRFVEGRDSDFDYDLVDTNEEYDDRIEEDRRRQDTYFDTQEPEWVWDSDDTRSERVLKGETGIQDF